MSILDEFQLIDDTDVAIDPETYQGQTNPPPPAPGVYGFKVKAIDFKRDKQGKAISYEREGRTYPVIQLEQVEIVDPDEAKRLVMLYQDVKTTPFERVPGKKSTEAGDFLRSFDAARRVSGLADLIESVFEVTKRGEIFYARLDWTATDLDYVEQQMTALGLSKDNPEHKKDINTLWNNARVTGYKKFPVNGNGRVSHVWVGPSGTAVEARPKLMRFYASNEKVPNVGPVKEFSEPF